MGAFTPSRRYIPYSHFLQSKYGISTKWRSKGAYLNRELMEELYMKQLIDFEDGIGQVCRLVKSIYNAIYYSGCTCNYENRTIRLSQTHYIHQIFKEFDMEKMNTVSMPMGPNMIQH